MIEGLYPQRIFLIPGKIRSMIFALGLIPLVPLLSNCSGQSEVTRGPAEVVIADSIDLFELNPTDVDFNNFSNRKGVDTKETTNSGDKVLVAIDQTSSQMMIRIDAPEATYIVGIDYDGSYIISGGTTRINDGVKTGVEKNFVYAPSQQQNITVQYGIVMQGGLLDHKIPTPYTITAGQ